MSDLTGSGIEPQTSQLNYRISSILRWVLTQRDDGKLSHFCKYLLEQMFRGTEVENCVK